MLNQAQEQKTVKTISSKIPLELMKNIKERADWLSYPMEESKELPLNSLLVLEASEKTQRLLNEVKALNDFWLNALGNKQGGQKLTISLSGRKIKAVNLRAKLLETTPDELLGDLINEHIVHTVPVLITKN